MKLFLHRSSCISPANTDLLNELKRLESKDSHYAIEPDYSEYLSPGMTRRMSRVIKMGVYSALACRDKNQPETIDAIITATGFGCFDDSVKFLTQIIKNDENLLSPTPFIQSTHNTVGAQIALLIQCQGYNNTHVHGGLSFENALIDAAIYSTENPSQTLLLGASDELTDTFTDLWKNTQPNKNKDMNLGEGAVFFICNQNKTGSVCEVSNVKTFINLEPEEFSNALREYFANSLNVSTPDIILFGLPKKEYESLTFESMPAESISYKEYCGEYYTASGFAVHLSLNLLKARPDVKQILVINKYGSHQYSIIHLKNAQN
ncbi:MAG: beta-ketoacyl synthase chain length factor [Flavobacteriales bacterium]|nr:beta-ketoacyl synthase chain length factor [Flavobacteriales bacterium]